MKNTYKAKKNIHKNGELHTKKGKTLKLTPGSSWQRALEKTGMITLSKAKPVKTEESAEEETAKE